VNKTRNSVFDTEESDLDLSAFTPKAVPDTTAPPVEQVKAFAEAVKFPSREARLSKAAVTEQASTPRKQREPRRHRTGRNIQFNCKATQETIDTFYALADQNGWLVGETLERAVAALQREVVAKSDVICHGRGDPDHSKL
jgi:hypothetical protein